MSAKRRCVSVTTASADQIPKLMKLVARTAEMNGKSPYDPTNSISPLTYGPSHAATARC